MQGGGGLKPMRAQEDFGPRYNKKNLIGSGAYGDVYEAVDKETGKIVAIKQFKHLFDNKFVALRALREVTLLRVINFSKVIKIYEILPPKDEKNFQTLAVALEYLPMDLKKISEKIYQLDDLQIEWILYQIVCTLKYLKSAKILHRDLKPENILISKDLHEVKICDFGLARSITAYEEPKKVDNFVLESLK